MLRAKVEVGVIKQNLSSYVNAILQTEAAQLPKRQSNAIETACSRELISTIVLCILFVQVDIHARTTVLLRHIFIRT